MIGAFDLSGGPTPYGNIWTSIASGFKAAGGAIGTGAKTVGTAVGKGAQTTATAWKSLDPQTQAFLMESGQTALAQALAARQQRLAEAQLTSQAQQQAALMATMPGPSTTTSGVPPWLLPVAILGGFGLVAMMLVSRRPAPRPRDAY